MLVVLKRMIFKRYCGGGEWQAVRWGGGVDGINVAEGRHKWRAAENTAMKIRVS